MAFHRYTTVNQIIYIFIWTYALCFFSMKLFMCSFVPFHEFSEILCVHLPGPFLLSICQPLLVWPFTFTEKSDCDITFTPTINLALSVISTITILVKLLQMIWCYVTNFLMCQSLSLGLYLWKIYTSHHVSVCHLTLIFRIWSFFC